MRALAWVEKTMATCSTPGTMRSAVYRSRPVSRGCASVRRNRFPTTRNGPCVATTTLTTPPCHPKINRLTIRHQATTKGPAQLMPQTIFFLARLKPGISAEEYEAWVERVDYPRVREISAILEY